ncbi:MAG TPA: fumarate reductase/succinate dehydrogenase flavoprotein subunit [Saprospiraceae bacterium]|nr:fumarate reductase/succinate dehydrogenase flavoprotein subunit [Saprospiraceae bacterium]
MKINGNVPEGPLATKWTEYRSKMPLVAPNNKRKLDIIVVGTGLAGASAAASFGEMGYNVKVFTYHDSPRRAHSIAAQGGINAAKNYQNDGDSNYRLFYDTVKGGDYRSREANVYRLAEVSGNIIDQCVAQGVPFAREYGGTLANRSFGGVLVSRTFYARGQTGQQLLLGAYSALSRQIATGQVIMHNRREMLDLVLVDGKARGIIARNLVTGELERHSAHAVVLATGGYGNLYYLSTNAMASNATAAWRAAKHGAYFANPCYVQIHPTCIPQSGDYQSKLTLMSESLRNDGRIWVPKHKEDVIAIREGKKKPTDLAEEDRDYYLERRYPAFGNLVPRDVASRAAKIACDQGGGVNATGKAVFLDFASAIQRYGKSSAHIKGIHNPDAATIRKLGEEVIEEKYGNLFEMYERITGDDPYKTPMMIYPAVHYTMGGLWVDYNLQSNIPGLFVLGEANFSDHGANRLGASALMQGLADGYFVIPYTIGTFLSKEIRTPKISTDLPEFAQAEQAVKDQIEKLLSIKGKTSVEEFHKELGRIMWEYGAISRNEEGLKKGRQLVRELRERFWKDVFVPGSAEDYNNEVEKAGRVADFMELAELLLIDAEARKESAGGHFREEYQTEKGEALRNDKDFAYVAAWKWNGWDQEPELNKEELEFKDIELKTRSYE